MSVPYCTNVLCGMLCCISSNFSDNLLSLPSLCLTQSGVWTESVISHSGASVPTHIGQLHAHNARTVHEFIAHIATHNAGMHVLTFHGLFVCLL